jgi:two-component system phosphate regulon sensor histidine kinase PhoR
MFAESILLNRIKDFARQKVYLEMILKESTRLKGMINNILEYSQRNENPGFKYSFKEGDLSSILNEILTEMKYWFEVKKISLSKQITKGVLVKMDSDRIRQVLENLISNAIKFTPESGEIKIRLKTKNSQHLLEIEDNGFGIPEDQINKIFDRFYRVSGTETEGISGTGLGLTVVKEIIEAHNWKIMVKSKPEKGSIFYIII